MYTDSLFCSHAYSVRFSLFCFPFWPDICVLCVTQKRKRMMFTIFILCLFVICWSCFVYFFCFPFSFSLALSNWPFQFGLNQCTVLDSICVYTSSFIGVWFASSDVSVSFLSFLLVLRPIDVVEQVFVFGQLCQICVFGLWPGSINGETCDAVMFKAANY